MSSLDMSKRDEAYDGYPQYMDDLFECVNICMNRYLDSLKEVFASEQGGFKNVLYPDLEVASGVCEGHLEKYERQTHTKPKKKEKKEKKVDDELSDLLGAFANSLEEENEEETKTTGGTSDSAKDMILYIEERAKVTVKEGTRLPFYELCEKLKFEPFTVFTFAAAILSSTQTDYASIFQIINENGSQAAPTIEGAAKLYFGSDFSITGAYGDMSIGLEQLMPIFDLNVIGSMPFATLVSPDKRIIDFLFGKYPEKLDENYIRFFKILTDDKPLDPIMANGHVLDAMKLSYNEGVRIFSYYGDDGSGKRFFIKNFCHEQGKLAISVDCKKLFVYDFRFVDKAIWAITRECILLNAYCVLAELSYREEEKEKFFGYMDLAFAKLVEKDIMVFAISKEKINFKEVTKEEYTQLELPTPSNNERWECWKHYSKGYALADEIDLLEMSTKFLFTPGKVADALKFAKSLSVMNKEDKISRADIFEGCNNQMSSELTQKATKVKAVFGFDDIVMNPSQREAITHAIEQMTFKKNVYEDWNYMKKYPYGRGLTVLLYGAPGTGKSMMAQVIAHELNLELYRVDISKVVDKYVGETEKSLSMIFREAKKCNVVLFFDECDTIFAKRSDDGGSNQSSNNNKTALLLQEMEAYDGVCVLATNYKHNIDPAFFRRMKYIVEFQFPDPDTREMLWRTTIPKTTPLAEDVDIRFLAERFEFAGGNIKNCILNAAFLAAADGDGKEVHMKHYLEAIKYEFVKTGKVFTKADFEPYASEIGL